ncbi:MAG: hypothetical protein E7660_02675 [Ruminococcaceae bacterium]|nr:hypothetical protein [Oscillospiraceae bacterium]
MRKIYVADYSLKKLSEDRKASLLFREKTAIAECIEAFGADAVELDEIKSVKEDTIIYRTIASKLKNCALCIPVGFSVDGIEAAWECVKDAAHPCLQVALPVSTVQMEYMYHVKEAKMLTKLEELVSASKAKCENVEFIAMDATRADKDFLINAIKAAKENGASAVTVCDDAGVFLPTEFSALVTELKAACDVPLYVKVSDGINMATACAFAAVRAGADGVKTAISGKGALLTHKFAEVIRAKGETMGVSTSLKATEIATDVKKIKKTMGSESNAQSAEGNDNSSVILDKGSTLSDVTNAACSLGYDLSDEDNGKVYSALMNVLENKSSVGAKELEAIIASSAMQAPSTYHLESYVTSCSNVTASMTQVVLVKDGEKLSGVASGDGPVDSAFKAIEQSVGFHYELDDFQIQAVTEGKEALGSAVVKLRAGGRLYSGSGVSADIVAASIRAYINALNKIVYEEI